MDRNLPCDVIEISWQGQQPFPRTRNAFFAALAAALPCREEELQRTIRVYLAARNLIFLHPCVCWGFADVTLARYYSEWLAELLSGTAPLFGFKCIQPIEWAHVPFWQQWLALLIRPLAPDWASERLPRQAAMALVRRIESNPPPPWSVHHLPELRDIVRDDVEQFCRHVGVPEARRQSFTDLVMSQGRSPETILQAIADFLPEMELT